MAAAPGEGDPPTKFEGSPDGIPGAPIMPGAPTAMPEAPVTD